MDQRNGGNPTNSAKSNIYSILVTQIKSESSKMGNRGTKQDWHSVMEATLF